MGSRSWTEAVNIATDSSFLDKFDLLLASFYVLGGELISNTADYFVSRLVPKCYFRNVLLSAINQSSIPQSQ